MYRNLLGAVLFLAFAVPSFAQVPQVPEISDLPADLRDPLTPRRDALVANREALLSDGKTHNARCRSVAGETPAARDCAASQSALLARLNQFRNDLGGLNNALSTAFAIYGERIVRGIAGLVVKLGWGSKERERLNLIFKTLTLDGTAASSDDIQATWKQLLGRGADNDISRAATLGQGPGLPGAGTQTRFEDCTIFALANASGQPYGVVAARATDLLRQATWRDPEVRANPQHAIERRGLNGGEVIFLAESLGRADVISSGNFAETLRGGRNIIVTVVPPSGRVGDGHAVVLSKTFQHAGQTWFEIMDSNQGPIRRLYASQAELGILLKENGIAYSADANRTPQLLR